MSTCSANISTPDIIPTPICSFALPARCGFRIFFSGRLSYTEMYVTPKLWPDFTKKDLFAASKIMGGGIAATAASTAAAFRAHALRSVALLQTIPRHGIGERFPRRVRTKIIRFLQQAELTNSRFRCRTESSIRSERRHRVRKPSAILLRPLHLPR